MIKVISQHKNGYTNNRLLIIPLWASPTNICAEMITVDTYIAKNPFFKSVNTITITHPKAIKIIRKSTFLSPSFTPFTPFSFKQQCRFPR